jgi:heme/copper-type cytochrome/quinol oxidase subunit 3
MSETAAIQGTPEGVEGLVEDWASDKQTYNVPWGKAMMWIFLVSDTFIFTCFLTGYLNVRLTTTEPWPLQTEIFPDAVRPIYSARFDRDYDVYSDHELRVDGAGCKLRLPPR